MFLPKGNKWTSSSYSLAWTRASVHIWTPPRTQDSELCWFVRVHVLGPELWGSKRIQTKDRSGGQRATVSLTPFLLFQARWEELNDSFCLPAHSQLVCLHSSLSCTLLRFSIRTEELLCCWKHHPRNEKSALLIWQNSIKGSLQTPWWRGCFFIHPDSKQSVPTICRSTSVFGKQRTGTKQTKRQTKKTSMTKSRTPRGIYGNRQALNKHLRSTRHRAVKSLCRGNAVWPEFSA